MRLTVSPLSPHNLRLPFCYVLSIFALIYLARIELFCAAIKKYSVHLLWFLFIYYFQVILYPISSVCRLKYPYSCFSSYFCLLVFVVLLFDLILPLRLLADVISLSFLFFFILEGPVLLVFLDSLPISFVSLLSPTYLGLFLPVYCQFGLCGIFMVFSFHCVFVYFSFLVYSLVHRILLFVLLASFWIQLLYFRVGSLGGCQFCH